MQLLDLDGLNFNKDIGRPRIVNTNVEDIHREDIDRLRIQRYINIDRRVLLLLRSWLDSSVAAFGVLYVALE